MSAHTISPTYEVGCRVIHICTPDLPGYVIDWRYTNKTKGFEYQVTWGSNMCKQWLDENELKPAQNEHHQPN